MKLVAWLTMSQPDLAKAEVLRLLDGKEKDMVVDLLVLDAQDWKPALRLAFTRALYEFWWRAPADKLWEQIDAFEWKKHVRGSFAVSVHHGGAVTSKKVADRVWHWLETPTVNLKKPDTAITLFFVDGEVICGRFLWACKEDFEKRRPHLRGERHPITCHPRVARALVNLTGAPVGADILDPFCGTGGLMIEAGLMGMRIHGSDISADMVEVTKKNLEQFSLDARVLVKDAAHLYSPEKYVVTELPYGRSSGKKTVKELEDLYLAFLERLDEMLRVRAVITYPHTVNMQRLLKKTSLKEIALYSERIHRSLTKKIVVLEPGKRHT